MPKRSTVTHKTVGKDYTKRIKEVMHECRDAWVTIGIHDDAGKYADSRADTLSAKNERKGGPPSVVQIALWNEYGTPGAKHPIPARSFLRATIAGNGQLIMKWRDEAIEKMVTKNWPVEVALAMIGFRIRELIRNAIKRGIEPANAPWTIREKQGSGVLPKKLSKKRRATGRGTKTLINTGLLLDSIKYQVWVNGRAYGSPTDSKV